MRLLFINRGGGSERVNFIQGDTVSHEQLSGAKPGRFRRYAQFPKSPSLSLNFVHDMSVMARVCCKCSRSFYIEWQLSRKFSQFPITTTELILSLSFLQTQNDLILSLIPYVYEHVSRMAWYMYTNFSVFFNFNFRVFQVRTSFSSPSWTS